MIPDGPRAEAEATAALRRLLLQVGAQPNPTMNVTLDQLLNRYPETSTWPRGVDVLEDHPGYAAWMSKGIPWIHADWPVYPIEQGTTVALESLAQFPSGSTFRLISDIDQCSLLVMNGFRDDLDDFDELRFHVAIWHDDLLELSDRGWVTGVERVTEREYQRNRRDEMRRTILSFNKEAVTADPLDSLFYEDSDGTMQPLHLPPLSSYQGACECECDCGAVCTCADGCDCVDCWPIDPRWAELSGGPISLTAGAWDELGRILQDQFLGGGQVLGARVNHVFSAGYYDAAIRELSVAIESHLRQTINSTKYGIKLVLEYFRRISDADIAHDGYVRTLSTDVRTAFMYVRNEYAHNLVDVDRLHAVAIVSRLVRQLSVLRAVSADYLQSEASRRP